MGNLGNITKIGLKLGNFSIGFQMRIYGGTTGNLGRIMGAK